MNKEDYVSLEVAKLLKEKGFDKRCEQRFVEKIDGTEREGWNDDLCAICEVSDVIYYPKPTLYEAQKWLRNNHGIAVNTYNRVSTKGISWSYEFNKIETCKSIIDRNSSFIGFDTYEEALNEGILEALKLI